jgi:leucyl aminopeptidase (aminopeptidase T)
MIKHNMFIISNPGITQDWLTVLNPSNSKACQDYADKIEGKIGGDVGGEVHIIADRDTDLLLKVPNGNWTKEVGQREGKGTNGLYGEFATAPYEANGIYVLQPGDFLTNPINEIVEEITLTIRSNRVVEIRGGVQAETLKLMLEEADNPLALNFNLGEFAIGINPARPRELQRSVVAEKLLGSIHIAIGTNSVCLKETCPDVHKFAHGRYSAGVHIDAIKFNPSVFFTPEENGKLVTLLKDGKLMV